MNATTEIKSNPKSGPDAVGKWKPDARQLGIIEEFAALVERAPSQAEFCRQYLPFGEAKLGRILNALDSKSTGSYFDQVADPEAVVNELEAIIEQVAAAMARSENAATDKILLISQLRAIKVAISEMRRKIGPERLGKYIAPTGGGKSIICNYLECELGARVVEARESWKKSYFTFLEDICRALRIRLAGENRPSIIERKIIDSLGNKVIVLVIDEGEFFGREALNGIKLLLNKTRLCILVCAIPEAHDRWNRFYPTEAEQISRRTHAIVELTAIKPDDAALFFAKGQFTDEKKALDLVCGWANSFGHYSFVSRLARKLDGDTGVGKETLENALKAVRRQMLRDDSMPEKPAK